MAGTGPDLEELDEYGGGSYEQQDHVADLLHQIQKKLIGRTVGTEVRRESLDEVLPFIRSGNAGMDDNLYEVAYAARRDDADWRYLAEALEAMGNDWPLDHARRIYRKIGDHGKYLELRRRKMATGCDYHDLAGYYWSYVNRHQVFCKNLLPRLHSTGPAK